MRDTQPNVPLHEREAPTFFTNIVGDVDRADWTILGLDWDESVTTDRGWWYEVFYVRRAQTLAPICLFFFGQVCDFGLRFFGVRWPRG